ncbi:hydrogen peroxide-inducible genes activator [Parvularcula dongshanensis]|uniref:hydrogen peroxide-inducible genes activator n=1 Tax=Parvularcula dongshanensis TaxID=1173995 RepID=UPI00161726F1|nr:hydrogen peroxide-inducible genes activator [Parvularcula dongshanensis]
MPSDPTIRQLRYLTALASCLSFRKAAERCGISQPSLSAQLKALETSLGVRLAERGSGSVVLTPVGREVAATAIDVLDRVDALVGLASRGPLTGVLRLGVKPTLGPYLMPHVVRRLHATHPDLRLFVREAPPIDLERELIEGVHDVVLAQLPLASAEVESVRLFREPLLLAVASDHPLARQERFDPGDLKGLDVLTLSPRYHLHEQVLRLCEENEATLRRDYEGTSLDALRQMVGMGLGVTFLPALYVASEVRGEGDVAVLKPARAGLHRSIGLGWRRASGNHEAYEALGDAVTAVAAELPHLSLER